MKKGYKHSTLHDKATFIGEKGKYPLVQDKEYLVDVTVWERNSFINSPFIEVCWDNGTGCIPYRSIHDMLNDWEF